MMAAVTDKDAAFRESMAAELQRLTRLVLEAAELALPALAVPQELNIGVPPCADAFSAPSATSQQFSAPEARTTIRAACFVKTIPGLWEKQILFPNFHAYQPRQRYTLCLRAAAQVATLRVKHLTINATL